MVSVWVLGDQLTPKMSALANLEPSSCVVVMIESVERARHLKYHKQKLVLLWSAMRHFRDELRRLGYTVDYFESQPDYQTALQQHIQRYRPGRLRMMEASEYGVTPRLVQAVESLGVPVEITPNTMFITTQADFQAVRGGRQMIVMEDFYRAMRQKTGLLMDDAKPAGGQWNYDSLNREAVPPGHVFPDIPMFLPDAITREVIAFVDQTFPDNFGELEHFWWPVTRDDAEHIRQDFLDNRLDMFGPYEDALVAGERALYHSLMSALMNIGLLDPLESCQLAEVRYREGHARINSVEGYIRQLLGWREFIRQYYLWKMPDLRDSNHFGYDLPLPQFYLDGDTDMFCVHESVTTLRRYGITHHIQRLMVLGNFALLAGIRPQEVKDWFWLAYADAYEWVVTPNVIGISQYADGGQQNGGIATKPYVSGANYINKMSNYCEQCRYNPRKTVGESACPFNALYWDFLARNAEEFGRNRRMQQMTLGLARRSNEEMDDIRSRAAAMKQAIRDRKRV